MTTLTLITLAVIVVGAFTTNGYQRALAIGGATPIGAALVFGDVAVPTFYAVAIGAAVGLAIDLLRRTKRFERDTSPPFPGFIPLVLFAAWSIVITILAPQIFNGMVVVAPDGTDRQLAAGFLTTSNLAQIVYLLLGIAVVVFLAKARWAGPEIIGLTAGLLTLLSFWKLLNQYVGMPFPEGVFDNSPAFAFIESSPGGGARFRGILSEPSGLAISSLVTVAYMVSRATYVTGARRVGVIVIALMAAFLASISTSGTFVVASIALIGIAGLVFLGKFVLRRGPLSTLAVTAACAAAIAAVWLLPLIANTVEQVVTDKVASSSFEDRSGSDNRSYELVVETFGLGVGLGANRPSSFLAALLSTTGIIGTVLLVTVVWTLIHRGYAIREYRPVVWALVALLITKVIASPDLADTSGILWMSLGILAHASVARNVPSATGLSRSQPLTR